jgi:3-deoxy-D-arabino-heptulosonate 7-phosphate (DAHP) synthase
MGGSTTTETPTVTMREYQLERNVALGRGFDDGFKSGWEAARKYAADRIRASRNKHREKEDKP